MKNLLLTAVSVLSLASSGARAESLTLDQTYLRADGVILSYPNVTNFIDPYFPTKALLVANDAGMDVSQLANGWINWLLPRQEQNGLFSRFCQSADTQQYKACKEADADDSMMAMWIELLYRSAPNHGMPEDWRRSAAKAQVQLNALFNHDSNVYFISKALPVGLLMDNIEIYASLKRSAYEAKRLGDIRQSAAFHAMAARLRAGILTTFWDAKANSYRITTQARNETAFYPDHVAQMIPLLHDFKSARTGAFDQTYASWMQAHKNAWMGLIGKDYPWGLVAVVSTQRKDFASASCWIAQTTPHRHSGTWDIVDEAAYQAVAYNLKKSWPDSAPACEGAVS